MSKRFVKRNNLIQYREDDIQNYLSTVMFRGTPCKFRNQQKCWKFCWKHCYSWFLSYLVPAQPIVKIWLKQTVVARMNSIEWNLIWTNLLEKIMFTKLLSFFKMKHKNTHYFSYNQYFQFILFYAFSLQQMMQIMNNIFEKYK